MNTYGLNRHLNSFGLSYPGYWFIIVDDGTGSPLRTFVAYGTRDYITGYLTNLWGAETNEEIAYITSEDSRIFLMSPLTAYIAYRLSNEEEEAE
jgi:hypothetical protein